MSSRIAKNFVTLDPKAISDGIRIGLGEDKVAVKKALYFAYNNAEPVNHIAGSMKFRHVVLDVRDGSIVGATIDETEGARNEEYSDPGSAIPEVRTR